MINYGRMRRVTKLKRKQKIYQNEKIVMFPGTVERLLQQGHAHAEKFEYHEAIQCFQDILQYGEMDEHTLHVYAYCLHETRQFEQAREVVESLLAQGPSQYIETMELYLSICMELRDFQHVQQIVRSLLEENVVPNSSIERFTSIYNLSEKLLKLSHSEQSIEEEVAEVVLSLDVFLHLPVYEQLHRLQSLSEMNVRPLIDEIRTIIETEEVHPIVRSVALCLLVEQEVNGDLTIRKFEQTLTVNPMTLPTPDELPVTQSVKKIVNERLEKESSTLEMVQYVLTRHILVTYPFEWFGASAEKVSEGYIHYVHSLLGQEISDESETDNKVMELIQQLEKFSDIPEV